jgi:DNA-directed RNA polymerase subunit RPC12/RpoP
VKEKVADIDARKPHSVSEVICVKCGKRWISVRPERTLLKHLRCENCGKGYVIETGQVLEIYEDEQNRIPYKD